MRGRETPVHFHYRAGFILEGASMEGLWCFYCFEADGLDCQIYLTNITCDKKSLVRGDIMVAITGKSCFEPQRGDIMEVEQIKRNPIVILALFL